jgi:hypothetical protein
MGPATIGVAQKEDEEEPIDEQDIILVMATILRFF